MSMLLSDAAGATSGAASATSGASKDGCERKDSSANANEGNILTLSLPKKKFKKSALDLNKETVDQFTLLGKRENCSKL